jgi:hypothetical protein
LFTHILAVGGARSGKTFAFLMEILARAYRFPGTRQLVARFRRVDVKEKIFEDTLLKCLAFYPKETYTLNRSDLYIRIFNGSEIRFNGLDTPERIDKALGSEYCTIMLNECSEISYSTAILIQTRLAQNIPGLVNKAFYDLNPVDIKHWTNELFINLINPRTKEPITNPEDYTHIFINPVDNKENLPDNYFKILDNLPDFEKNRFLYGIYQKLQGGIYNGFNAEKHVIAFETIQPCDSYCVGVDLITYAAVLIGFIGNTVYAIDEVGDNDQYDKLTAAELNDIIKEKWGKYKPILYLDHNLGQEGLKVFDNSVLADKGPGSVEFRITFIQQLIKQDKLRLSNRCLRTQFDLENYRRNPDTGQVIKKDYHFGDAFEYGVTSHGKHIINNVSIDMLKVEEYQNDFAY